MPDLWPERHSHSNTAPDTPVTFLTQCALSAHFILQRVLQQGFVQISH